MTKHAAAHDPARPSTRSRRRRPTAARPRTGALAAVGVGLLLFVGLGQAVAPRLGESGAGELAYALWSNPVPSFLALAGRGPATTRGIVPVEPPRALAVPDTMAGAAQKPGSGPGPTGNPSGASAGAASTTGTGRGGVATTTSASRDTVGVRADGVPAVTSGAPNTSASAVARAQATPTGGVPIKVFFSRHPDSDATFTAVSPVKRTAPDQGVAAAALAELIDGPTTEERAAGYYSELGSSLRGPSSCAGRDFQLSIRDGVATVRFCRAMTSAGIGQDARVRAQIEATLTQFSTIRSTRLLTSDGHCLFDESGQDRCLGGASPAASARPAPAR